MSEQGTPAPAQDPAPTPPEPNYVALKARLEAAKTEVEGRLAVAKNNAASRSYLRQQAQGEADALAGELAAIVEMLEEVTAKIPPEEPAPAPAPTEPAPAPTP